MCTFQLERARWQSERENWKKAKRNKSDVQFCMFFFSNGKLYWMKRNAYRERRQRIWTKSNFHDQHILCCFFMCFRFYFLCQIALQKEFCALFWQQIATLLHQTNGRRMVLLCCLFNFVFTLNHQNKLQTMQLEPIIREKEKKTIKQMHTHTHRKCKQ